ELLETRVRAHAIVVRQHGVVRGRYVEWHHLRCQASILRSRRGEPVRPQRELILLLARDVIELGHLLGGLSHGLTRGRFGDGRRDGYQVAWPDPGELADARAERPGPRCG